MSNKKRLVLLPVFLLLAACAPTQVQQDYETTASLPKPDSIVVYYFAVSPDEVQLDRGLGPKLAAMVKDVPVSDQEREAGHKVAYTLANDLVEELANQGLSAQRTGDVPPGLTNLLEIRGQFVSIDQGNRTKRNVIGLGAGRSDVQTHVQVYMVTPRGHRLIEEFDTEAKSGYKPGMAETMGAGVVAGHIATSAALSAGGAAASEVLGADVEADARRTAKAAGAKNRGSVRPSGLAVRLSPAFLSINPD